MREDILGSFACVRADDQKLTLIDLESFKTIFITKNQHLLTKGAEHDYLQTIFMVGKQLLVIDTCGNLVLQNCSAVISEQT